MLTTETELLVYLDSHHISYQRFEHPAVFTCEQAERYCPRIDGVSTKNLLLRDRRGRFFLAVTGCEKAMDLKALGREIRASKLHFASEDQLLRLLGVTPGAVTLLGLVNDLDHEVNLLMDGEIWGKAAYLCHPLVNTATLALSRGDVENFLQLTGHAIRLFG